MEISIVDALKFLSIIIGTGLAGFNLHKLIYSVSDRRDEYKFAKEFLDSLNDKHSKTKPFIKALGYKAIAGFKKADENAVKYIVELENGIELLYDYRKSWAKVEFDHEKTKFQYKKYYKNPSFRNLYVGINFLVYFASASLAIAPFFFTSDLPEGSFGFIIVMYFFAYASLPLYAI